MRRSIAPDPAAVAEAKKHGHDLIVMGVGRRPGDRLYFGETATGILEDAPISVMLVASRGNSYLMSDSVHLSIAHVSGVL
jgi:nucleotide-binding universal stress UspA family protein